MRKLLIVLLLVFVLSGVPSILADSAKTQPVRQNYMVDTTGTIDSATVSQMNSLGKDIQRTVSADVVVYVFPKLNGTDTISLEKVYLFNGTSLDGIVGIGKSDGNKGVLLVFVMDTREWAFVVGSGLKTKLSDAECGNIGKSLLDPIAKGGSVGDALLATMMRVATDVGYVSTSSTTSIESPSTSTTGQPTVPDTWYIAGIAVVIIVVVVILLVRRERA